MTRKEAIEIVKTAFSVWELEFRRAPNDDWSEEHEALDMAIETLRQETVSRETYDHEFNLRKEFEMKVFELEKKIAEQEGRPKGDLISRAEAIDALRYAQHRFTVADEAGGMGSVKWSEDVIYFAAAERVLTELPSADRPRGEWVNDEHDMPTIEPKRGRWIKDICEYDRAYHFKCSVCGEWNGLSVEEWNWEPNFCPNCGADMRGEKNNGSR